jgi:hypothetical protein
MAGKMPEWPDLFKESLYELLLYPIISAELLIYRFDPGD